MYLIKIKTFSIMILMLMHMPNSRANFSSCLGRAIKSILKQTEIDKNLDLKVPRKNFFETRKHSMSKTYKKDREKIATAYSKFKNEAPKINFELHLKRLLDRIPPEESKKIQDFMKNRYIVKKGNFDGTFDPKKWNIINTLPEKFIGTDVEYFMKMHEAYHLMNHILSTSKLQNTSKLAIRRFLKSFEFHYLDEAGAMAQEWHYLNSIPNEVRENIAKEISASNDILEHHKNFLIRSFKSKSKTSSGYILSENKAGRSRGKDMLERSNATPNNKFTLKTFSAVSSLLISLTLCQKLEDKNITAGVFYKFVCKNHPMFVPKNKLLNNN